MPDMMMPGMMMPSMIMDNKQHKFPPNRHDGTDKNDTDKKIWQAPSFEAGHVWLVGAGPGDLGLMTRLADHALSHADIVFYDALLNPALLTSIRAGARHVFVGKRGGTCSPSQEQIHHMLIDAARESQRVLRLKGGDPFVFGRGGEEALALCAAGIPFRIIPGITSGTGALAAAGIPLTHRGLNSCAAFVTGHDSQGQVPQDIDWPALCKAVPVLVFFMALRRWGELARRLIDGGRALDEDVAIITHASTPQQKVYRTTLQASVDGVDSRLSAPALIVIGPVVGVGDKIIRGLVDGLGDGSGGGLGESQSG